MSSTMLQKSPALPLIINHVSQTGAAELTSVLDGSNSCLMTAT